MCLDISTSVRSSENVSKGEKMLSLQTHQSLRFSESRDGTVGEVFCHASGLRCCDSRKVKQTETV